MNQIIKPTAINFTELLKYSTTTLELSETTQSKLIDLLNEEFTEEQQHLYVTNLWMYMNYHQTNEYPINLEDVFKMIGFANKGNAKRTLENNFTKEDDYKITFLPSEKGQIPREEIMLNTDTFKSLCMLAKTPQGKEMRKYYVKLENINHILLMDEIKEQKLLINKYSKEKEDIWLKSFKNKYVVYLIKIDEFLIKYGFTKDFETRFSSHKKDYGKNIEIIFIIESVNNELLETSFENHIKIKSNIITQEFNGQNKQELIKLNKNLSIHTLINILRDLNDNINIIIYSLQKSRIENKLIEQPIQQIEQPIQEQVSQEQQDIITQELELTKEKTKQMEIQLEILKYKQQPIKQIHISEEITFDEKIKTFLINNLEKVDNAKVQINTIFNKLDIEFNKDLIDTKTLIKYVNEFFNIKFIKYNNHFVDLRFKNCSSIYPIKVYQDFIEEHLIIKNKRDKNYHEFKYKIKYDDIYSKFKEYTLNLPRLIDNNVALFEKDFKEFIIKLTNSRLSSDVAFDGKKCKGFIGLMLK
mgnify:FL=1